MNWRVALAGVIIVTGCGGEGVAPATPGTLSLRLATPNANDGALVVVISGGPVSAVHATGGLEVAREVDGAGTHLLIVGDLVEGVLATIDIPDIAHANAYVAVVEQVADRTSFGLLDAAGYHLTLVPPP